MAHVPKTVPKCDSYWYNHSVLLIWCCLFHIPHTFTWGRKQLLTLTLTDIDIKNEQLLSQSLPPTGQSDVFSPFISLTSIPLCTLINQHLSTLARKFPQTKFLKSISTTCIPNYPDRNLPTIFVYFEGEMKAQFIGPLVFGGMNLKVEGKRRLADKTEHFLSTKLTDCRPDRPISEWIQWSFCVVLNWKISGSRYTGVGI